MAKRLRRPDDDVRRDIEALFYWDGTAAPAQIRVDVENGTVTLSGTVTTVAARRAAENDALLSPGVRSVANRLTVRYPPSFRAPDDRELAGAIRDLLRWNSDIAADDIRVTVIDGMALIEGSVPSQGERISAGELAASVAGIDAVNNRLSVSPSDIFPDEALYADIAAALDGNPRIPAGTVTVEIVNGAVLLTGTVPDRNAFRAAEDAVRFTPGVVSVKNELSIG